MDVTAISGLVNTVGMGGVFLYAAYYLMKRLECRESQQREEALAREERLLEALKESETYMRTTAVTALDRSSQAMAKMAVALEGLACRDLRAQDLRPVVEQARRRAGEG